ncbi:hypothetical protein [Rhodopila globiformis]|uniref:hypothetical protein n=1 Tax=Rhodopila globiformis TaxID=1071 RepID=UPI0011B0C3A2|nr:hypothetical protein [Rhodopila globiformis]
MKKTLATLAAAVAICALGPVEALAAEIDIIESAIPGADPTVVLSGFIQNPDVIMGSVAGQPEAVYIGNVTAGQFASTNTSLPSLVMVLADPGSPVTLILLCQKLKDSQCYQWVMGALVCEKTS